MFLRRYRRTKEGKTHTYYALVESIRTEAGPRQRVVAHLGELNHDQERRWQRTIVFHNRQGEDRQLRLFPDDDQVDLADDPDVVRISLIRIRKTICAVKIRSRSDRPDLLRIQADSPPGLGRRVPQGLVIRVHSVGPVMRTQVTPQVLHRVELRRVRQQPDQAHVLRHHEPTADVVSRVVPQQHGVHPGFQPAGELRQEQVDHRRVQLGHDQPDCRPAGSADRRQHVQRLPPVLAHPPWPRATAYRDPGERPLLPEPGLVMVPDLDLLVGVSFGDRRDLLENDLLEEPWASGCVSGCCGRGIRSL